MQIAANFELLGKLGTLVIIVKREATPCPSFFPSPSKANADDCRFDLLFNWLGTPGGPDGESF